MRRNILIIAAFLTFASSSYADTISESKAREFANRYMGSDGAVLVGDSENGRKSTISEPAYFIYNFPEGGWIIVAGDDVASPVLAYNGEGEFRNAGMPRNISFWLETLKKEINSARKTGMRQNAEVKAQWKGAAQSRKSGKEKLLNTAEWDQGEPYNYYCPTIKENRKEVKTITGCVSTAMAIYLQYMKWPEHGNGTLPAYSYLSDIDEYTVKISGFDISSHNYDYASMPLKDKDVQKASTTKQQAIARLIYDLGVMMKSTYNYETGTGAYTSDIIPMLSKYMYYSRSASLLYRYTFPLDEWIEMLKTEIDSERPVLYSAYDDTDESGHQFIISGYDSTDKFYVNWGWGGSDNGYYAIKFLSGTGYKFSEEQDGIFGLVPDPEGKDKDIPYLTFEPMSGYDGGIEISGGSFAKGETFKLSAKYIWNSGNVDFNGYVKPGIIDKDGNLKEYIGEQQKLSIKGMDDYNYYSELSRCTCTVNCDLEYGDVIALFYQLPDGNWKKMDADCESLDFNGVYPAFDVCTIKIKDDYSAGETLNFSLTKGQKEILSVKWYFDKNKADTGQITLSAGIHTLKAEITFSGGYKETLIKEFVVQ